MLWNLILDEALGTLLVEWQRKGYDAYLPSLMAARSGRTQSWGDMAGWVNLLANLGDHLLLAKPEAACVCRVGPRASGMTSRRPVWSSWEPC